jgi:hypothetical protein
MDTCHLIPENIKSAVMQMHLEGGFRDEIARECGLSTGAVSGIFSNWKKSTGIGLAEQIIDLCRGLRRIGISVVQCATGCRIYKMLNNIGIDDNNFELFLTELYSKLVEVGLSHQEITMHLQDLLVLMTKSPFQAGIVEQQTEKELASIPLVSQIPEYIVRGWEEKNSLENDIARLKEEKGAFERECAGLKEVRKKLLADNNCTRKDIEWYSQLQREMEGNGLPVSDISKLIKAVKWVRKQRYNLLEIIGAFSDYQKLLLTIRALQEQVSEYEKIASSLGHDNTSFRHVLEMNRTTVSLIDELRFLGFGFKELKQIRDTVVEVIRANGLPLDDRSAVEQILEDIRTAANMAHH